MIEIGEKIDNRYRITSRIAHGGMADVYEARDILTRNDVAIKIIREDMMGDPKNIEKFNQECADVASLNSPYIVKVYGRGIIDGRNYMVNEYVPGRTLRDKLNLSAGHFITPKEACSIMLQLTAGIQYAHDHGIIHRDIKPDNLFYLSDGSIKIADFGIAMKVGQPSDHNCTLYYAAPEVLTEGSLPCAYTMDIYSMGIVFYEILTGHVPFYDPDPKIVKMRIVNEKMEDPSKGMTSVPPILDKIINLACKKNPEDRYQSAQEMHDAIEEALNNKKAFKEKRSIFSKIFGFK